MLIYSELNPNLRGEHPASNSPSYGRDICIYRLDSGNTCYHSVQNLLFSRLLSKNIEIKMYKTIILPVVVYGCEMLSLILREEHRLEGV
jgi:hypothetical protein